MRFIVDISDCPRQTQGRKTSKTMKSPMNSGEKDPVKVDLAVVGGGLAGCALVWEGIRRGYRVALVDKLKPSSSSRVAAGLVTPITGGRFALSWRFEEYYSAADSLYRFVQESTQRTFWSVAPALRIFTSSQQRTDFEERWTGPESAVDVGSLQVELLSASDLSGFAAPWGGFSMSPAARLGTEAYVDATRAFLGQQGLLFDALVDLQHELVSTPQCMRIEGLDLQARWIALAQGLEARSNAWFGGLPLHPARGDVLEVFAGSKQIEHVVHRDGWIVPLGPSRYLLGATYARDPQECLIESPVGLKARAELIGRWESFFDEPQADVQWIEQRASVRPASYDRHPLIGSHPEHRNLICLNGLGSKGSLMAPRLAQLLLDELEFRTPIEKVLRYDRRKV